MSGFDLPNNYLDNPETLLRKNRSRASSSATPPAVKLFTPVPSTTIVWPIHFATTLPPLLPMCLLGPLSTLGLETLSCALALSRWCRQTNFVVCQVRTQTLTFNTSLSCVTLSSLEMSHQLASSSVCFPSPSWGRRNNGLPE
jgi:hypothetical protein